MKQQMTHKLDKPLLAMLYGAFTGIPAEIGSQVFKYYHIIPYSVFDIYGSIFHQPPKWAIGVLVTPAISGFITLVIYWLTKIYGRDYLFIKGAIIGASTYGFVDMIFGTVVGIKSMETTLAGHFILAALTAFAGGLKGLVVNHLVNNSSHFYRIKE